MAAAKPRRLIINADDFGRSEPINRAVIDACQNGVLTTASLMVAGDSFEQAVRLARDNPKLGVGLHLTLCCGRSVLPHQPIPSLADDASEFRSSPVAAGLKYFFSPRARAELRDEISAQFQRFAETGLPLDHLNGHLHFHLHPAVFPLLPAVRSMRLTRDPLSVDWPLGRGRIVYRISHAIIFALLSRRARPALARSRAAHTAHVFGLLEDSRVTEDYILRLLPRLPEGDSELYSHPSLEEFKHEHEALVSPRVRDAIRREQIQLIRYQDLWPSS